MARRKLRRGTLGMVVKLALFVLALWAAGQAPWLAAEAPGPTPARKPDRVPAVSAAPAAPPAPRIPTVAIDPHSAWASAEACAATIATIVSQPRGDALRIASWNLHWFPNGRSGDQPSAAGGTDVEWMACAMASLRADVIAIQEVTTGPRGRTALLTLIERLDDLTSGKWREVLDECRGGRRQHVGFLYDSSRVTFADLHDVAALNPNAGACAGGLRPGVIGRLRSGTTELQLLTVHLDSGGTARDYNNRLKSIRRMTEAFPSRSVGPLLALGDFNTMGCGECELPADVAEEVLQLENLLTPAGYAFVHTDTNAPTCSEHFGGKPQLLDRAVTNLPAMHVKLEMAGLCAELACRRPRTTSAALSRLSDHCPIVVELTRAEPAPHAR